MEEIELTIAKSIIAIHWDHNDGFGMALLQSFQELESIYLIDIWQSNIEDDFVSQVEIWKPQAQKIIINSLEKHPKSNSSPIADCLKEVGLRVEFTPDSVLHPAKFKAQIKRYKPVLNTESCKKWRRLEETIKNRKNPPPEALAIALALPMMVQSAASVDVSPNLASPQENIRQIFGDDEPLFPQSFYIF